MFKTIPLFLLNDRQSMLPLLKSNDVLYFKKVNIQNIKINDIVIVKKNNNIFCHRIIYRRKNSFITKGDNSLLSDGTVLTKHIIGKVIKVRRQNKFIDLEGYYQLRTEVYFQEVIRIKNIFEDEGINFLFLKGVPLYYYYEKSYPLRIYADCDVLIDKNDWEEANKILEELGYRKAETSYSKIHKLLKDKPTEFVYVKNINNFPVIFDIHLEAGFLMNQLGRLDALYPQLLIDKWTGQFLKEKKIMKIQNELFPILSPANLIIYLSLHFFHHNFRGAFRLEFLDKVIRKSLLNPPPGRSPFGHLPGVLLSYKLQNFVYPVFLLLKKYYSTPLPRTFLPSIKPNSSIMSFINKNIIRVRPSVNLRSDPICIFDDEPRIAAGITRFRNLFFLSPNPFWKKILIIFNPQVIFSGIFSLISIAFERIRVFFISVLEMFRVEVQK